jgi:hypothetical protein
MSIAIGGHRSILLSVLLGLAALLVGCGKKSELERLPVHGTVRFASGEKLSECSISFLPKKGVRGPPATTGLTEGSYKFDRGNGPTVGPHIVKVMRVDRSRRVPGPPGGKPPDVNAKREWTTSADVLNDGEYRLNFDLKDQAD